MAERFMLLEEAIKHCLALLNTDLIPLSTVEWQTAKEMCTLLEPFFEVTKEMSSEKYLNASKIIPITRGLKSVIGKIEMTLTKESIKVMAAILNQEVETRFANLEMSQSSFLDPRYKYHMFEDEKSADNTKQRLIKLVTGLINQASSQGNNQNNDQSLDNSDKNKKISVWDYYEETMKKVKPKGTSTSMAIQEVQQYMDDDPISKNEDPLKWWKNHQHVFPNLAKVVRLNCNIMATSVPCERVFSKTGYILSERRTHLTSAKLKQLVFLNMNLK